MSSGEEGRLMFPSLLFRESFQSDAATPDCGVEQKKASRQRRRRKARQVTEGDGDDTAAKKRRLSDDQAQFLEMSFRKERNLETPRKVQLAAELGLDTKQVAVWLQNRRARYKNKLIEEEFSKLRAAHDAALKERLAETEEEKSKIMAVAAIAGGEGTSPSSSSLSTVTNHAEMVEQFEMEEALTYMSDNDYNSYLGCVYS